MIIVEDTRNQIGKHKKLNTDLEKLGVKVIRSKLYIGDYTRLDNMNICIDTKKDYVELASNICGKEHTRFRNECLKAKENGIKLIILVEENCCANEWQSPRKRNGQLYTKVNGKTLYKAMQTMAEKYGVEFCYCDKKETAQIIIKILEDL